MMHVGERVVPALSVALLALLAVLPWGLPPDGRFVLPFLPVVAIFYWSSRHPDRLSPWIAFQGGLVVDVLSNGPLGYWPLIYLGASMLGVEAHGSFVSGAGARWAQFVAALLALVIAAWGIASLYDLAVADWQPFAWALWLAVLAYPAVVPVLNAIDPVPYRASNDRLVRGA